MMYVLCKKSPSTKKTPHIYEMIDQRICPVCGELVKTNPHISGASFGNFLANAGGHIASENPDVLMKHKKRILKYRRDWLRKEA